MDRDRILQSVRERYEEPVWRLISELEQTLRDLGRVEHIDLGNQRSNGSVLNSALESAAISADLESVGLAVAHYRRGDSNKLSGSVELEDGQHDVSFELHLCGPKGGTSKASHQLAGYDIESEPALPGLPGLEMETASPILLYLACHLAPTGASVARAFFKFADGTDQRKIEIHRSTPVTTTGSIRSDAVEGAAGTKLRFKKLKGEEVQDGSKTAKRGDAASSSQKT